MTHGCYRPVTEKKLARFFVRQERNGQIDMSKVALQITAVVHERRKVLRISSRIHADVKTSFACLRQAAIPLLDLGEADRAHAVGKEHDADLIKGR